MCCLEIADRPDGLIDSPHSLLCGILGNVEKI